MVCRICLLDSTHSMDIFGLKGKQLNIAEIVGQHFWFKPKEDDNLSKNICSDCWQHVDNFHSFYLRVELVQKNFLSKTSLEFISAGEIKAEAEDYYFQDAEDNLSHYDQDEHIKTIVPLTVIKTDEVSDANTSFHDENTKSKNLSLNHDNATIEKNKLLTDSNDESSDDEVLKSTDKKRQSPSEYVKKSDEKDLKIAGFIKLKCDQCEYEGETFADVKKHYETVHEIRGFVTCCKKKFRKRSYLFDHIEQHLNPEHFKCKECDKNFINKESFQKHLKNHSATRVKSFKCDECSKEFHSKPLLSRHKFTHVPLEERKFVCDVCKKLFGSFGLLRQHQRFVHENVYGKMCHICAKVIRGKKEFAKHQMEHEGIAQPKVKCQICGALLKSQTTLNSHMHSHTDNTEYVCNMCGKKKRTKRNLESHIKRVHSARYSYKCTICDKTFKRKIELTEHLTTHTGERLYNCPYCSKSYTWNGNLHAHKKKAHPKEWEECRKTRCTRNSDVAI